MRRPPPLLPVLGLLASLGAGCGNASTEDGAGGTTSGAGGLAAASGGASGDTGGAASGGGGAAALGTTYLKASNTGAGDLFGVALALSADGTMLVVGASGEASAGRGATSEPDDDTALGAGAVYVFELTAAQWEQTAYLKAENSGPGDGFGSALALSADGRTLVVGAPFEASEATGVGADAEDDGAPAAGAAYVFVHGDAGWTQEAYLKASNGDADDYFGVSLALSADGSVLAVGAEGEDGAAVGVNGDQVAKASPEAGAVYVFSRSGTAWTQAAYLKASNTDAFDHFGGAVALSAAGTELAVGAYREDSAAIGSDGDQADDSASSAGAVYVFEYAGAAWEQMAYLKARTAGANASGQFGCALSLAADGKTLAVGAVGDASAATGIDGDGADGSMPYAGAAYVFSREGDAWQQLAYLKASNTGAGDEFGHHLHLAGDGQTLVVGAALEGSQLATAPVDDSAPEAGAAYVFARRGATFEQVAFLKGPQGEAGDRFGWSLALSENGATLAVGASREASAATGVDGDPSSNSAARAGAVYVHAR